MHIERSTCYNLMTRLMNKIRQIHGSHCERATIYLLRLSGGRTRRFPCVLRCYKLFPVLSQRILQLNHIVFELTVCQLRYIYFVWWAGKLRYQHFLGDFEGVIKFFGVGNFRWNKNFKRWKLCLQKLKIVFIRF